MTSTLQRSAPGVGEALNGSIVYTEDGTTSGSDSQVGELQLLVVLPDNSTQTLVVDAGKHMMDLLVEVAAANHLSPPKHTLRVYNDETGQPIQFKPSRSIGSLGVSTVYLVPKGQKEVVKQQPAPKQSPGTLPFVKTQRLTVNLPRNQKHLLRVDPKTSLAQIYQTICQEKGLDPYKYELRHPTDHDQPLNMSRPLEEYGITEITVVSATAPESPPPTDFHTLPASFKSNLRPASSETSVNSIASNASTATMPRRKQESEDAPSYMPGGSREKKKKGFLSLFSRKKSTGSFSPPVEPTAHSSAGKPPVHPASTSNNRQHAPSTQQPPPAEVPSPTPQSSIGATQSPLAVQPQSQRPVSQLAPPSRQNRKKRPAPPPPDVSAKSPAVVSETVERVVTSSTEVVSDSKEIHSRQSSRSSGFEDTPGSPVESPGTSGAKHPSQAKPRLDSPSADNTHSADQQVTVSNSVDSLPRVREVDATSDISSPDSAQGSLPRPNKPTRKKKMAPAPPPVAGPSGVREEYTQATSTMAEVHVVASSSRPGQAQPATEAEPDEAGQPDTDVPLASMPLANGHLRHREQQQVVEVTNRVEAETEKAVPGTTVTRSSTDQYNGRLSSNGCVRDHSDSSTDFHAVNMIY